MYQTKRVFAAACLGLLLFGMVAVTLGSVLPEIVEKFQVTELQAGFITSLLYVGILIGSLFFGPIADRYGYKGLMLACCLLIFFGLQGIAFGTSWFYIQLSVVAIGTGGGALNGATSALVADISEEKERGARLSLLGIFYGLGAILMPMILAALATWFSRETIFMGIGGFIGGILLYLGLLTFPSPKQQQGIPFREMFQLLKNKTLLSLSAILLFQSGMESIVSSWTTSFLQAKPDILPQMALMALTVHMAALTGMRLLLSRLLSRYAPYHILVACLGLIFAGCLLLWVSPSYSSILVALVLLGGGFAGGFPIVLAQVSNIWSDISATAFSVTLALSLMGGISINYVMGIIAHQFGIQKMPLLLLATALCLGIAVLVAAPVYKTSDNDQYLNK